MEINSPMANGIPDNFETLTPEQLKLYRITYGHYLSPTTILRLLEPRAYFAGLIWEMEELLKDKHHNLKSGYKYHSSDKAYSGNNSDMQTEQIRLSEKEYSEEFDLSIIRQLFVQHKENRIVSDRQLHVGNTLEPINSPASEIQKKNAVQTFMSFNSQQTKTSETGNVANCTDITNHEEEQHNTENVYQNSLECQKEAQGIQHANCSSGFDNKCDEYVYNRKEMGATEVSRSENEYIDSLSNDEVKCEDKNFNNNSDKGRVLSLLLYNKDDINGSGNSEDTSNNNISYLIQGIYQTPVYINAPSYSMLDHST